MSVVTSGYARAGFTTTLAPPRPGIYYSAVALYNPLAQVFTIQNGVNQNSIAAQTAQLYAEPMTGSPMRVQAPSQSYPYGAWLGPVSAVWFDPSETPGSYPVTLGALAGLVQWTPAVSLGADPIYVVPGAPISSVVITNASDTAATITVTGTLSHAVVGSLALSGSSSATIPLTVGTGDSVFAITSSAPCGAVVSLFVGVAPLVNNGSTVTIVSYASLTGPGETATPGDLTQAGGFTVNDVNGDGISFTSTGGVIDLNGDLGVHLVSIGGNPIQISAGGQVQIEGGEASPTAAIDILASSSGPIHIRHAAGGSKITIGGSAGELIGLYGTAGVIRAPHPVTLADVIAILTNIGACA